MLVLILERGAIKKDRREVRVKTLTPSDVRTCQRGHVTSEYLTPFHTPLQATTTTWCRRACVAKNAWYSVSVPCVYPALFGDKGDCVRAQLREKSVVARRAEGAARLGAAKPLAKAEKMVVRARGCWFKREGLAKAECGKLPRRANAEGARRGARE